MKRVRFACPVKGNCNKLHKCDLGVQPLSGKRITTTPKHRKSRAPYIQFQIFLEGIPTKVLSFIHLYNSCLFYYTFYSFSLLLH